MYEWSEKTICTICNVWYGISCALLMDWWKRLGEMVFACWTLYGYVRTVHKVWHNLINGMESTTKALRIFIYTYSFYRYLYVCIPVYMYIYIRNGDEGNFSLVIPFNICGMCYGLNPSLYIVYSFSLCSVCAYMYFITKLYFTSFFLSFHFFTPCHVHRQPILHMH